jgi:hypothetical protein
MTMQLELNFAPGDRVIVEAERYGRHYATVIGPYEADGLLEPAYEVQADGGYVNTWKVLASWLSKPKAARDMVIGDLLNLDMLKEVIEVEFIGSLWTKGDSGPMTPYVCECSFGDGYHLMTISTINQRPNYHVVRVDSGWARDDEFGEHIDEIMTAIEEECGRRWWNEDDRRDGRDAQGRFTGEPEAWPAFDDAMGCAWGHIEWRWLLKQVGGTAADCLPLSWMDRYLRDKAA